MNDSMKIENRWARAFVILLLTLGAIAMLFPFFWMISGSFKTIREITFTLMPIRPAVLVSTEEARMAMPCLVL